MKKLNGNLVDIRPMYKHDVFTVKQYGEYNVKISYIKSMRESGWEPEENL